MGVLAIPTRVGSPGGIASADSGIAVRGVRIAVNDHSARLRHEAHARMTFDTAEEAEFLQSIWFHDS